MFYKIDSFDSDKLFFYDLRLKLFFHSTVYKMMTKKKKEETSLYKSQAYMLVNQEKQKQTTLSKCEWIRINALQGIRATNATNSILFWKHIHLGSNANYAFT